MTYTEIKDLLASGFTPEQITALTTSAVPIAADHNTDPVDPQDPEVSPAEDPERLSSRMTIRILTRDMIPMDCGRSARLFPSCSRKTSSCGK